MTIMYAGMEIEPIEIEEECEFQEAARVAFGIAVAQRAVEYEYEEAA